VWGFAGGLPRGSVLIAGMTAVFEGGAKLARIPSQFSPTRRHDTPLDNHLWWKRGKPINIRIGGCEIRGFFRSHAADPAEAAPVPVTVQNERRVLRPPVQWIVQQRVKLLARIDVLEKRPRQQLCARIAGERIKEEPGLERGKGQDVCPEKRMVHDEDDLPYVYDSVSSGGPLHIMSRDPGGFAVEVPQLLSVAR
jgi:hypothetical protein